MTHFTRRVRPWLLLAAGAIPFVGMAGCRLFDEDDCTTELQFDVTPRERTLRVGETFTPEASFTTCGGRKPVDVSVRWSATDSTILRVDPQTGSATGLRAGTATLAGYSDRLSAHPILAVTVRVTAP